MNSQVCNSSLHGTVCQILTDPSALLLQQNQSFKHRECESPFSAEISLRSSSHPWLDQSKVPIPVNFALIIEHNKEIRGGKKDSEGHAQYDFPFCNMFSHPNLSFRF